MDVSSTLRVNYCRINVWCPNSVIDEIVLFLGQNDVLFAIDATFLTLTARGSTLVDRI